MVMLMRLEWEMMLHWWRVLREKKISFRDKGDVERDLKGKIGRSKDRYRRVERGLLITVHHVFWPTAGQHVSVSIVHAICSLHLKSFTTTPLLNKLNNFPPPSKSYSFNLYLFPSHHHLYKLPLKFYPLSAHTV